MTGYQLSTLIAFLATLAVFLVLEIMHLPEPAAITSLLGSFGLALLPSMVNRTNVAAARASMRPPPMNGKWWQIRW
jgi:hypothetical protein